MKEQWKKLDSDAKLLLNVEEGRAVPIKIELPISAFASRQPNCCKGLITTLRISVLFLSLLLLGWTAKTLYSSYFYDGEIGEFVHSEPLFNSEENKQVFKQKVYAYESQKKNFDVHESNDVGSPESNNVEVTSENSPSNEYGFFESNWTTAHVETSTQSQTENAINDSEEEKELKDEQQSKVEAVSESNNVDEEKNVEEAFDDKLVHTFYHQIDSVAMDDDEIDENIIDQFLHNIRQIQVDNSIENDRQWKDASEAEREIEELEKQTQKELEDEVNKVLGKLFENAAMTVLDELTKGDSKNDNSKSTSDSEEKGEAADHDISINSDEMLKNKSQDLVKWIESIIEDNVSEPETESGMAITQNLSSEETNSEEDIDKQSTTNDEIESPEDTFAFPTVEPVVIRKVEREDIMAIVAKRLEPVVGENYELLLWYLANKDKPIFEIANDPLKVNTAKMLYSNNVREYGKDSAAVVDLIADESYEKEFEKIMNPAYDKIQPETEVQREIVFRLQEKSNIFRKLNEEPSSFEESLYTELIDAYNNIDEGAAHQKMEEITDRAKEEESADEAIVNHSFLNENKNYNEATTEAQIPMTDNDKDSSQQSLLQAMRNVGTFQDKNELMKFQDTVYHDRLIDRIPEQRLYFSDEDVLGTYDPLLAQRLEPMFDPTNSEQSLYEILQKIVEGSEIENNNSDGIQEEQDNQDIRESLVETSKDADEEEKSFQVERQDEADSDPTLEMTTDASQNVADKYYQDILEVMKTELIPEGIYASNEDFYTSVISILHRIEKERQRVFLPIIDVINAIEESNKLRRTQKYQEQLEQDNQNIQEKFEEDSEDTNEEEKSSQMEWQDKTSEVDSDTIQNILETSRNLLEILKNEYKTDLVPEGMYASDEDFYASVIPILHRMAEKRQSVLPITDIIDAIEESNKSRQALKDNDQEHLVSRENPEIQNSEEVQPDQSNQEEAEMQPDQSNSEEAEIQPDQSNQEEPEGLQDQSNQEEAEIQPDQSNQEEDEIQPNQSNQEETEIQPDQWNQEEPDSLQDQSNQEEAEIQPDQSNQEEDEIQPNQSNQEETEIQPDQWNHEEPESLLDQSNQEEIEEQPSMNEFLTLFHDEYDGDY